MGLALELNAIEIDYQGLRAPRSQFQSHSVPCSISIAFSSEGARPGALNALRHRKRRVYDDWEQNAIESYDEGQTQDQRSRPSTLDRRGAR